MAGAKAKMPCLLVVIVMALSAKVCSAQPASQTSVKKDNPWGAKYKKQLVKPAADVLCPVMSPLGQGTYLEIEQSAFLRIIMIRQKTTTMDDSLQATPQDSVPETEVNPAGVRRLQVLPGVLETTPAPLAETVPMNAAPTPVPVGPTPTPADRLLGRVFANFWSVASEFELYEPLQPHKLIATIKNPLAFWDNTQDIYNCKGMKVGDILSEFVWRDVIQGKYTMRKVRDRDGNHVANLREDEISSTSFFGSRQYFLYLESLEGVGVASMRKPQKEWSLGPFTQTMKIEINSGGEDSPVGAPANTPEFLSLVFASALAGDQKVGPIWSIVLNSICFILLSIACCCCFCRLPGTSSSSEKKAKKGDEENESLLGKGTEKEAPARSVFNCCSRTVAPVETAKMEASNKA